jgi:siroheme synthase
MEKTMKKTSLIALLVAATAIAAAPAVAKTSLSKGKSLCEAAAKAATPAPKSVRTDNDATKVSDTTLTYKLRVKNADDSTSTISCKVDRETDVATVGS